MTAQKMLTFKFVGNYLQGLTLLSKKKLINTANFLDHCSLHTSSVKLLLFESDPKGDYKKLRPKPTAKEQIRESLKLVKDEIGIWKRGVRDAWDLDFTLQGMPGVVDKAFEFKNEDDLSRWIVTSDRDNEEGESTCELTINKNGKGLFTGNLCLDVPKDGKIKRTGYCNIRTIRAKKTLQRDSYYNWGMYTHLVMRVRGDGRTYGLNLNISGYFDITWNDIYTFALFTRGGPYWQYSRIPFSRFFFTSKGRIQDKQSQVPLTQVASFGITLAERAPGPFNLEIDYIGLEYDPSHSEEFAYEMYNLPENLAA